MVSVDNRSENLVVLDCCEGTFYGIRKFCTDSASVGEDFQLEVAPGKSWIVQVRNFQDVSDRAGMPNWPVFFMTSSDQKLLSLLRGEQNRENWSENAAKFLAGMDPMCDVCGTFTIKNGTCYKCPNCGNQMEDTGVIYDLCLLVIMDQGSSVECILNDFTSRDSAKEALDPGSKLLLFKGFERDTAAFRRLRELLSIDPDLRNAVKITVQSAFEAGQISRGGDHVGLLGGLSQP